MERERKYVEKLLKKKSYKNTFKLRKLDPQINMPCIVSRALILFTNPKDKRLSKCNLHCISVLLSKVHKERQNIHFFELKWLNCIRKKQGTFSLFAFCSSGPGCSKAG